MERARLILGILLIPIMAVVFAVAIVQLAIGTALALAYVAGCALVLLPFYLLARVGRPLIRLRPDAKPRPPRPLSDRFDAFWNWLGVIAVLAMLGFGVWRHVYVLFFNDKPANPFAIAEDVR